jgi:Membrane protein involved in the export of O-antigen and teichoic acid
LKIKVNQLKAGVILSYTSIAVQSIIAIAYTPVMLRLLGKSEYGVYNLVYSIVSYLGLLSFGFGSSYMRFYSRYKAGNDDENIARLNGMFLTIFSVIAIIALVSGTALTTNTGAIFSGGLTEKEIQIASVLMAIMVFNVAVSFPASIFDAIVTANEQYVFQRSLNLLRSVLNPFLSLPLLLMGHKSISLVIVTTFLTLASFAINVWFCFKKLKVHFIFNHFNFGLLKEIWIFSFYIFLNMVVDQANWNVDKFILGKFRGSADVAVYSIGAQLNSIYLLFSTSISSVFIPKVNNIVAETDDNNVLTLLFTKVGRIQLIVLSLISTGLIFFGKPFILMWAGDGYKGAYSITLCLILSETIPLFQNLGIEIQRAKNKHRFRSILYFGIAIMNVVISIPLSQSLGGLGAAIGTAIAQVIGNIIIMNWYYTARIGLNMKYFWQQIIGIFPAYIFPAAFGVLLMIFLPTYNFITLFGCVFSYVIIFSFSMWIFGLNLYEKTLALQLLNRILMIFRKKEISK